MMMMITLNTVSRWKHTHVLSSLTLVIVVAAVSASYMQVRNYTRICSFFPSLGISECPVRMSGLVLIYVMTIFNFIYYVASKNEIFFSCCTPTQIGRRPPQSGGFSINAHLDTQTHTIGLFWSSNYSVAQAATYTTHNKRKRRTSKTSFGL